MVVFEQLRIDKAGNYLYIDAKLNSSFAVGESRIEEVWVCDSEKYTEGGIPEGAQKVYSFSHAAGNAYHSVSLKINPIGRYNEEGILTQTYDNLPNSFLNKMLFVYVKVVGYDELTTDCGCAKNPTIGVALSMNGIYDEFMHLIKELESDKCAKPSSLADFILKFNAMLLAIDSEHYKQGVNFFNKWFSGKHYESAPSNCGCHG